MIAARIVFVLLNGGAALAAVLFAIATQRTRRTSGLGLAALCGYLVVIHSAVLASGVMGYLTTAGAGVVLAAAIAVATWRIRRRRAQRDLAPPNPPPFTALAVYPVLAALASGALWLAPHLLDATRLWIWDDYTYHMVYPALWLRDHAIGAVDHARAFTMQAWYPLAADVVATWFMLPFPRARGDALAWVSLTGPLYAGIFALGTVELLRRLGGRRGAWATALVPFATSHRTGVMASSFSDADLAQAAALFAGVVFATPRSDDESPGDVRADLWYAALLTGIALGIKVTSAIPSLVVLAMLVERARSLRVAATRIALVFAAAWAGTGAYWYARNVVRTGNPVYPGTTFPETTLLEYSRRYGFGKTVADAADIYLNWPILHALLAVAGLLGLAGWLLLRRRRARPVTRPAAYFAAGALAITAGTVILLPLTPFSAGNAMTFRAGFVHWDSMRFVGLLVLLGWASLAFLLDAGAGAVRFRLAVAAAIASACLLTAADPRLASPLLLVALALGAVLTARISRAIPRLESPVRRAVAAGVLPLVVLGLVLWRHEGKATASAAAIHREILFGGAAAVLDQQPRGTRVAVFGDQWIYPAFGDRDHLIPIRLDGDGRIASSPIADAMVHGPLTVPPATFLENLRASGIDLVVVLHLPHPGRPPDWPAQHAALEASGSARLLLRHPSGSVWSIDRPPRPAR